MARDRSGKKRISTDQGSSDWGSNNPFAALDSSQLPRHEAGSEVLKKTQHRPSDAVYHFEIGLEKRGPSGSWSTLVIPQERVPAQALKAMLKALKSQAASGGSLKGEHLELQGEHCSLVEVYLKSCGHRTKRIGAAGNR